MASRDVSLVIRAKDEATKAFESAAAALESLLSVNTEVGASATETGNRLSDLANVAAVLDKAYAKINVTADNAAAAFARQQAAIAENKNQLVALQAQAEAAANTLQRLKNTASSDIVGPPTRDVANLKLITAEYERLQNSQTKLAATIAAQETALNNQQSSLQKIGSTAIAAEDAQNRLAKAIAFETEQMEKAATAATSLSALQQRINDRTGAGGVNPNGAQAGASAEILNEAAARDLNVQKIIAENSALKVKQDLLVKNAIQDEAESRARTLLPGSGIAGSPLSGVSASSSASVFNAADQKAAEAFETQIQKNAAAANALEAAAGRLRVQIDPLGAIQDHLNTELAAATRLYEANRISATELAQATALLKANADKASLAIGKGPGLDLFGLKPFQLQNLSFQINDIFTQLASGTSITQTLAQQGGQIFQIFPKAGSAILAALSNPLVIAFAAGLGAIVVGIKRITDQSEELRHFQGILAATADGTDAQAQALASAADALDHFGLSTKDALAIVATFNASGVNPDRITQFGMAAKDMADILGIDVKDAAKKVADAFTGTYTSVKQLDNGLNFLTVAQRDHIKALFDEGKSQEALSAAFDIFVAKQDEGARKARGPWTDAVRALGGAWTAFEDVLAQNSIIKGAAESLNEFGVSVTTLLNKLSGIKTLGNLTSQIDIFQQHIEELKTSIKETGDPFGFKQDTINKYTQAIKDVQAEQQKLIEQNNKLNGTDTEGGSADRRLKATEDLKDATNELIAKNKEQSDADRLAAAEKSARLEADTDIQKDNLKFADDAAKAAYTQEKIAVARQIVERDIAAQKERQAAADERAIKAFSQKLPAVEDASGDPTAKNPNSTATGIGQFTEQTWLELFRKNFPAEAAKMGTDAILELRKDAQVSKDLIEVYARQNAEVLKQAGQSVTEANLHLAALLGPSGALKVLQAPGSTPVSQLLSPKAIAANPTILQGKTADQVKQFAGQGFDDASAAQTAAEARIQAIETDRLNTQNRFNAAIDDENKKREADAESLNKQLGLQNTALIAEQRKQAVTDAILVKTKQIDAINADRASKGLPLIEFTDKERAAVEKLTGAYFDAAHARELAEASRREVQSPVDDLTAQRDVVEKEVGALQKSGQGDAATALEDSLKGVNTQLTAAIQNLITFWEGVLKGAEGGPAAFNMTAAAIQNMITQLKTAKVEGNGLGTQFLLTGKQINESIADKATSAIDNFAQAVADGKPVFASLRDAFLQFAADFLKQIADMILKQAIFNALGGDSGGGGGGLGSSIASAIGDLFHEGGVAGSGGGKRSIDPRVFTNAIRYHSGGIAGLQPNEIPAILKKGEEVLTDDDPRHVANGGKTAAAAPSIKNVIVFDPAEVLSNGLNTKVGQKTLITFVRENKGAIQAALNN